ncbi:16S rRNA (guanine(966)-N(2))-methyltransferase RsmD [Williamsia deligens]|uniref:16S rRNA (Guanine(966)-N(2))-methyltransferase RsmD n=1 Tax=Williamsia deligens TaxID=321325 RepID=A0ABW3GG49_9NOCA|nr:16S rRNA (guanine(966)-N(2))-methyltransferase RsmD [Williamsia deligens]MCP2195569.1 16S rRNA (guanine966-N2)-methyltransferase [Williamsia deligens]
MRIIAGDAGGRPIAAPPAGTRPTTDRVRESVFAMLEARRDLTALRVLDLYAGSGALALEALSRGAGHATVVDSDGRAVATIRANMRAVGVGTDAVTVVRRRVEAFLDASPAEPVDLVFCDPPYDVASAVVDEHMVRLTDAGRLAPDALVVVERSARSPMTTWPTGLVADGDRRYGDTRVEFALLA